MKTRLLVSSLILCFNFISAQAAESRTGEVVNSKGEKIGTLAVREMAHGTMFVLDANLPEGAHAMHLHAIGKCDAPDFKSSGGHFNPAGHQHGQHNAEGFHAGDLPNIFVEPTGHIKAEIFSSTLSLQGNSSFLGKEGAAIIIHENADDYLTDATGNAGGRIACAAIK